MNILLSLTLALVGGLILSRVVKLLQLPNVTGYLVAGILVGPYVLNWVDISNVHDFSLLVTVALGFIAFSIGKEFKLSNIKQIGGKAITTTVFESILAVLFVLIGLFLLRLIWPEMLSIPLILLLSAVAAATDPAATIIVIRQYKAKGPVTDTLLPVVAFDDAVGLMIFSICFALAKVFATGSSVSVTTTFLEPLLEIFLSLLIGAGLGFLLSLTIKFFKSRANRLCLMIVFVFAGIAVCQILKLSALLTCMMIGAVFTNIRKDAIKILDGCERWTPPLYMLFFVISGASLNFSILPYVGIVGIGYIVFRAIGKYTGAMVGSKVVKSDKNVQKYLGITLFPQAGVAISMTQLVAAEPQLIDYASQMVTIILSSTLIYELLGPVLTKIALIKAGEIDKTQFKSTSKIFHRHNKTHIASHT